MLVYCFAYQFSLKLLFKKLFCHFSFLLFILHSCTFYKIVDVIACIHKKEIIQTKKNNRNKKKKGTHTYVVVFPNACVSMWIIQIQTRKPHFVFVKTLIVCKGKIYFNLKKQNLPRHIKISSINLLEEKNCTVENRIYELNYRMTLIKKQLKDYLAYK